MSDPTADALRAERIERLTELARRVWPDRNDCRVEVDLEWEAAWVVYGDDDCRLLSAESHPRALDALEAALLVLAGDDTRLQLKRLQEQARDVLAEELARRTPAWVEQLAAEWDAMADHGEGGAFRECAQELREKARRT